MYDNDGRKEERLLYIRVIEMLFLLLVEMNSTRTAVLRVESQSNAKEEGPNTNSEGELSQQTMVAQRQRMKLHTLNWNFGFVLFEYLLWLLFC